MRLESLLAARELEEVGDLPGELIDFDYDALEDEGLIYIKDAEFLPRPLRLSRNEGIALTIGLRTLRETADAAEHAVIDSALAKLEDAVGDASRAPVDIHVEKIDPAIMSTVRQALADAQRLDIDYTTQSRDERAHRLAEVPRKHDRFFRALFARRDLDQRGTENMPCVEPAAAEMRSRPHLRAVFERTQLPKRTLGIPDGIERCRLTSTVRG